MPEHHYALAKGKMLAEYRIERVLGAGGFGITYYALDTNIDKPVAIKEYMPDEFAVRDNADMVHAKSSDDAADFRKYLNGFVHEAQALARFEHPHINKVHRFFQANGTAYMVLEYIDGETLSGVLRRDGCLAQYRLRRLLDELLSGLDEVHAAGYVHRDVKPANIMLRTDESAVLLDFGAARQTVGRRSKSAPLLMPVYAPIEQHEQNAEGIGPWTDLHAVGMVAYRCLSGISESDLPDAVTRANWKRRGEQDRVKPAVEVGKGVYDENLLKAVDHAIEVYENDRPQSAEEMRKALGLGVVAPFSSEDRKSLGEKFLGRDFSPIAKDENGWTDLHYAAAGNWVEVAEFLLGTWACRPGWRWVEVAQFLLGAGANVNTRTRRVRADCDDAAIKTTRSRLNKILDSTDTKLYNPHNGSSYGSMSPLHIAAVFRSYDVSRLLLESGADVNAKAPRQGSDTPLHYAAGENANKIVVLLLDNGADIEAGAHGNTPLHHAVQANADKTLAVLLKNGANVDARHWYGCMPLHFAAWHNADKIAALLLKNGADIEAKDEIGRTPLYCAACCNADNAAALLLENGADIEANFCNGSTPLHAAARGNADKVAALLLESGANIAARNNDGETSLNVAKCKISTQVIHLLENY